MKRFLSLAMAAIFVACAVCAPIFTEAIAAPSSDKYIITDMSALPAAEPATIDFVQVADNSKTFDGRSSCASLPARSIDAMTPTPHLRC